MLSVGGFFLASNDLQRVKYLHPVPIFIKIGVLVRKKKCPEDVSLRKQPFLLSARRWGRPLQAAGSIFVRQRRLTSGSLHISEGRGTKSIVLNQGYITLRDPNTCLKAVNDGSF